MAKKKTKIKPKTKKTKLVINYVGIFDFVSMIALFVSSYVLIFSGRTALVVLGVNLLVRGLFIADKYFLK